MNLTLNGLKYHEAVQTINKTTRQQHVVFGLNRLIFQQNRYAQPHTQRRVPTDCYLYLGAGHKNGNVKNGLTNTEYEKIKLADRL